MLPDAEIAAVRAATDRYRAEREKLEARGDAGLAALVARLGTGRKAES
jgi:hypothetical protein